MPQPRLVTRAGTAGRHLSFSAVRLYQNCSLRYFFRYVAGLPEEAVSASLVFGEALHSGLAHYFEQVLAGSPLPSLDVLLEIFWNAWHRHDDQTILFPKGDDLNSLGKLADRMFRTFLASKHAHPHGTILGVEEELTGTLIPGIPHLVGRVDLLIDAGDSLDLIDLKTSRSQWGPDHVQDSADQLLLYHELARDLADGRAVRLSFLVLTKTKEVTLTRHEVEVDRIRIERMNKVVERVWRAIQAGHFFPSPSPMQCPTCPYREPCRKWSG